MAGPSRRDIGHRNWLNAVAKVLPPKDDAFQYTIRCVRSLESNGSSSMATVRLVYGIDGRRCSTTAHVGGVAMGLMKVTV